MQCRPQRFGLHTRFSAHVARDKHHRYIGFDGDTSTAALGTACACCAVATEVPVAIGGAEDMAEDGPPFAAGIANQRAAVGQHSDTNLNSAAMWDLERGGNPTRGSRRAAPQHTTRRPGLFRAAVRRVISGRLFLRALRQDGALPPPQLAHMPECVLTHVCSFLRAEEVVHLGTCSRNLSVRWHTT